jgi:hypothetical protein
MTLIGWIVASLDNSAMWLGLLAQSPVHRGERLSVAASAGEFDRVGLPGLRAGFAGVGAGAVPASRVSHAGPTAV